MWSLFLCQEVMAFKLLFTWFPHSSLIITPNLVNVFAQSYFSRWTNNSQTNQNEIILSMLIASFDTSQSRSSQPSVPSQVTCEFFVNTDVPPANPAPALRRLDHNSAHGFILSMEKKTLPRWFNQAWWIHIKHTDPSAPTRDCGSQAKLGNLHFYVIRWFWCNWSLITRGYCSRG